MSDVDTKAGPGAPDLSMIICTLNEGAAIRNVVTEICEALTGIDYEIIVLDDDSKDQTQSEVLDLAKINPRVHLHVRYNERGLSSAAIMGWDHARGRYLGVMDGDGQHDPKAIREMADKIMAEKKDLMCVSRYLGDADTGLSWFRDLGSRAATAVSGLVLKAPLTDPLSGCFIMTREWYLNARPKLTGVGFKILVDLVASASIRPKFGEVKAALRQRQGGESKLDIRVVLDLAALLVEKATNGFLSARFVLFGVVGVSGVFVYALVLALSHEITRVDGGMSLYRYQVRFDDIINYGLAIWLSMTWNFYINNIITFRDKRLSGWPMVTGLIGFYFACSIGALLSLGVAILLKDYLGIHWFAAGVSAALLSGVWNYWGAKAFAWNRKKGV
ncbi:glycosyltransferase [Asticcacaulis sp. SL142]|uniref:glycosyltransferase n=1 Tax=Asticcacaulis sp. SL142 TaxID=2995155 RepID=UPI00226CEB14|nr:glycosyltransferase [Asticcacaulis sp. SL142]WAC49043.1 glycosyltransferase [Asticcacaulis sp. SL142]